MSRRPPLVSAGLLAACLFFGACSDVDPATEQPASGVVGTVRLGPQCAVDQADQPCPDAAAAGAMVVVSERLPGEAYAAGKAVASGTTDADGAFRVDVPPGEYVVTAEAGMRCELMDAVVVAHEYAEVDVPCDTGIRAPAG